MKKIKLFTLAWSVICLGCFAQKAVVISEISAPFEDTSIKIVELYNAASEDADIS